MTKKTNSQAAALKAPKSVDPNWSAKVKAAKQARELGKQLRAGKPAQYGHIVGRHA